jgi:hypothetical protein
MSVESFEELKKTIAEQVPQGGSRAAALKSIEQRLDPTKPLKEEDEMAKVWEVLVGSSPATEAYEKRLAEFWRETGCAAEGAPYVIGRLLDHLGSPFSPFSAQSPQVPALAAAFLDEEHCPGARGLTEAEKAKLNAIRDRSPPPVPKQ